MKSTENPNEASIESSNPAKSTELSIEELRAMSLNEWSQLMAQELCNNLNRNVLQEKKED